MCSIFVPHRIDIYFIFNKGMEVISKSKFTVGLAILTIFVVVYMLSFATAQTSITGLQIESAQDSVSDIQNELEETEEGTTPDSAFWGIDVALDRIKFNLARNKAAVGLKIAQERLEEIKEMHFRGNINAAEKAAKGHAEIIAQVTDSVGLV